MAHTAHRITCIALLVLTASAKDQSRWSRQISTYTADISDWVPLPGPIERQPESKKDAAAEPRILSEPLTSIARPTGFGNEPFPSRTFYNSPANRQLYLQSVPSVPSAPQNFLTEQGFGQSIRFGLAQPNFPLSQGFVAPQFGFESVPQVPQIQPRPQAIPTTPVKYENFAKPGPGPQNTFLNPPPKKETPKFVDGYRAENTSNEFSYSVNKKPQSLQKIKYDSFEKAPKLETTQGLPKVEREEVQLLYVPLESLNRGQFNFRSPLTTSQLVNTDIYTQGLPRPTKQPTEFQRPVAKPVADTFAEQDYFTGFNSQFKENYNKQVKEIDQIPKYSTIAPPFPTYQIAPVTQKPKKLKPHQPPLAIFMTKEERNNRLKVGDVLSSLKSANSIAVLDSVNPASAPKVFIGPSTLTPPDNYVKFELPYLSNIENSDKKLRQLPFFVAPLSYNTPQGFAKIPFPSPHVGSVVINSQIKEPQTASNTADIIPNVGPSVVPNIVQNTAYNVRKNVGENTYRQKPHKQEEKPATQRPTFSYYSTAAPKPSSQPNYHSKYYSVEPQSVSSIRPNEPERVTTPRTGSYFLTNVGSQYNPTQYVNFQSNLKPEPTYTTRKTTTTTQRPTTTSTKPSTFPSPLLDTHNPYSINQAFHFSTPLDYHNYFDEYKEPPVAPESVEINSSLTTTTTTPTPRVEEVTEKRHRQKSTPNYLQNYSPEIHYESEDQNSRYPTYNNVKYSSKSETTTLINEPVRTDTVEPSKNLRQTEYVENTETQSPISQENLTDNNNQFPSSPDIVPPPTYEYTQYETSYNNEDISPITTTTTTTTSTTRRTPVRSRGRPRYTTARYESNEQQTRATSTRRPLRERRPLPNRPIYEANKITTEKPTTESTIKPVESAETTTQYYTRTRTRGRVHYKPKNEDYYEKKNRYNKKDEDLAYQRDVLHQNYPVTLMERGSTADIDAITEAIPKISSTKVLETVTDSYDTENAYTNERLAISQHNNDDEKDDIPVFTRPASTEAPYIARQSTRGEEYYYQSRSSLAPVQTIASYQEPITEKEETRETTPLAKTESDINSYVTESTIPITEAELSNYAAGDDYITRKEDTTESLDIEIKTNNQQGLDTENEEEENVVQTTPSYNRVRVRPGVVRQYHQATTESSRRRRPVQAVTYRPAFDRRRTTMRIEEIEADLKTKQVHSRPEVQDYKHPVYKPEPTTESPVTTSQESTTRRGLRRRRPNYSYTTTTTESTAITRRSYEAKNRFRGRRPTEKPTEKPEVETNTPTTTARTHLYNRYNQRPRLSERYNKKPEPEQAETELVEETEDQESNFSFNRPKYVQPDEQWSSKVPSDSFKPFNPNDIIEEKKTTIMDRNDKDDLDIITAKNEYDDILISVTPASNRINKKLAEIPPTLEALVEQSKVTKSDSTDSMSTFESMLEEVMKSLEEQDQDEYTRNVKKHKGGEIGEIPPERVITSGDNYAKTTLEQTETTTSGPTGDNTAISEEEDYNRASRRRGFWKKVKVRPATESIEFAESQYYQNTVNHLGQPIKNDKVSHVKVSKADKNKLKVTTYKPSFQFIKDLFSDDENIPLDDILPTMDISKIKKGEPNKTEENKVTTDNYYPKFTNPGDLDLGTGTPDPHYDDFYYTTAATTIKDRSDGFNFMDYLFGTSDEIHEVDKRNDTTNLGDITIPTEQPKTKIATTDNSYIPDEIAEASEINTEIAAIDDIKRIESLKAPTNSEPKEIKVETSSVSSFMDPVNILSTSVSTQVSHETEICFRGKCIKTNKSVL
ncbi:hypothetical protein K1T71_012704 [Dendrolimus kikuchii]|uniref:Uncharacterized protein n=1 Tax=Dendrolimus kikuchii TaxID=765133 RepID=A0ACC1CK40_9NEOP|nr:hypothetical protein K1T71_012704 [Dendrolimus kikuchii]